MSVILCLCVFCAPPIVCRNIDLGPHFIGHCSWLMRGGISVNRDKISFQQFQDYLLQGLEAWKTDVDLRCVRTGDLNADDFRREQFKAQTPMYHFDKVGFKVYIATQDVAHMTLEDIAETLDGYATVFVPGGHDPIREDLEQDLCIKVLHQDAYRRDQTKANNLRQGKHSSTATSKKTTHRSRNDRINRAASNGHRRKGHAQRRSKHRKKAAKPRTSNRLTWTF